MRRPFRLVLSLDGSNDVKRCLRARLKEAESGEMIGVALVAMYRRREWDYEACGEAHRNKAWTLGMLEAFQAKLAADINNGE